MEKIGEGWQYFVYDIGNGRILKKISPAINQFFFIKKDQKRKGKPISVLGALYSIYKVNKRARKSCKYIKKLLLYSELSFLGNPVFVNALDYEQDSVVSLKEFFNNCSLEEGKDIFNKYVLLIQLLWKYGFSELTFNFLGNVGINKNKELILSDFGELVFEKEKVMEHINNKKWLHVTCFNFFPDGELKDYYKEIMERELTTESLLENWKKVLLTKDMRDEIKKIIESVKPHDSIESEHISDAVKWIGEGNEIFRIEKPATPPKHLVSYFVLIDIEKKKIMLMDHIKAGLYLPAGGHVEKDENPKNTVEREIREELNMQALFIKEDPFFITQVVTVNVDFGHTDVDLWYLLKGDSEKEIDYDKREFNGYRWFSYEEILNTNISKFDPHMYRFMNKFMSLNIQ